MNDRELLELAAKAAGIEIVPCTCNYEEWPFKYAEGQGKRGHWNPLVNDGDALRLAVSLSIRAIPKERSAYAEHWEKNIYVREPMKAKGREERSLHEVMRRAIVRAAAEIGRTMP